jgi:hypothetical protein
LALVAQNALAEEIKKEEKVFSFYGTVYATQNLYNSEAPSARKALALGIDDFRPGVKANFGVIKADVQFEMVKNLKGEGGKDWDVNDAAITMDPETGGTADADNVYKSLWNSEIRKAQLETKLPIGSSLKVGLIRPDGGASNGFYYSTGLEGYGNGIGATVAHEFNCGLVKVTPALSVLNKVHVIKALRYTDANDNGEWDAGEVTTSYDATPTNINNKADKALHFVVKGSVAEKTEFAFAYGGNYNAFTKSGVNHIEASAAHTIDAIKAGVWMERNAYHVDSKNYGNVLKFGIDAGYAFNDNVKAIAGFAQTVGYVKVNATDTKDKATNEIFVGPKFAKDGVSAELAMKYAMDGDKPFTDSDGKAKNSAMSAWATVGYEM